MIMHGAQRIYFLFPVQNLSKNEILQWKSSTWFEERENQQDVTIRCLLSTSVSTCFGHHYVHLQENMLRQKLIINI